MFTACSSESESPEQFVERIIPIVQSNNEDAIHKTFVHTKKGIKAMILLFGQAPPSQELLDKQVNEMYQAELEDKGHMLNRFRKRGLKDWNGVVVDSISLETPKNFSNKEVKRKPGIRTATINAYLSKDGKQYLVQFRCVDFKTGKWQMISYPRFK